MHIYLARFEANENIYEQTFELLYLSSNTDLSRSTFVAKK